MGATDNGANHDGLSQADRAVVRALGCSTSTRPGVSISKSGLPVSSLHRGFQTLHCGPASKETGGEIVSVRGGHKLAAHMRKQHARANELGGAVVRVGFIRDALAARTAYEHEFGSGRLPERPAMRVSRRYVVRGGGIRRGVIIVDSSRRWRWCLVEAIKPCGRWRPEDASERSGSSVWLYRGLQVFGSPFVARGQG